MPKIVLIGAGSAVFAQKLIGDCFCTPSLRDSEIALVDIDEERLEMSETIIRTLNDNINEGRATVRAYTDRRMALPRANYVLVSISVGAPEPYVLQDSLIPLRYGLKQTFADTLGIGGLFRGLRNMPTVIDIANDVMELCPDAWILNYTNPMCMIAGAMAHTGVKVVGLCHSVQILVSDLLSGLGMSCTDVLSKIAGINHQSWLLEISRNGVDLYPEIRERAARRPKPHNDMVRYDIMEKFGYYVTESSNHMSEYVPYYIKQSYPELLEQFNINTNIIPVWKQWRADYWGKAKDAANASLLHHQRSDEFASHIMEAMETHSLYKINANVPNHDLINNLPRESIVEVPCLVDGNGITPCHMGNLPPQLAALNRCSINVQLLAVEAALTHKREHIYHAALLDPHTSAELPADRIIELCDEMIELNQPWLWDYE